MARIAFGVTGLQLQPAWCLPRWWHACGADIGLSARYCLGAVAQRR